MGVYGITEPWSFYVLFSQYFACWSQFHMISCEHVRNICLYQTHLNARNEKSMTNCYHKKCKKDDYLHKASWIWGPGYIRSGDSGIGPV